MLSEAVQAMMVDPVEHRLEFVDEIAGVRFYNDSKATSVDATLKAIAAFDGGLWVILGGKDKNSDYTPLIEPLKNRARGVLLIGAAYGWRLGVTTVIAYLAAGAAGLPVFAGPVGGLAPLVGPTAGYLVGFVAAAFIAGWLSERGWDRSIPWLFVAMGLGHIVILTAGCAWLAFGVKLGVEKAWLVGVAPFLAASVIKNALGAVLIPAVRRVVDRRR